MCLFTGEGEVPQPQVLSQVSVPGPSVGGGGGEGVTSIPGFFHGLWSQVFSGGTPVPGGGYPKPSQGGYPNLSWEGNPERIGVPPAGIEDPPGWDWGTP